VAQQTRGPWEFWVSPEGEDVRSFTIITTDPNAVVAPLHTRMPAILDPAQYDLWLDPSQSLEGDPLAPCPDSWLEAIRVSTRVNSVKNDDAECIEPVVPG
jgi:putative SOS response-associated peptidase YedK